MNNKLLIGLGIIVLVLLAVSVPFAIVDMGFDGSEQWFYDIVDYSESYLNTYCSDTCKNLECSQYRCTQNPFLGVEGDKCFDVHYGVDGATGRGTADAVCGIVTGISDNRVSSTNSLWHMQFYTDNVDTEFAVDFTDINNNFCLDSSFMNRCTPVPSEVTNLGSTVTPSVSSDGLQVQEETNEEVNELRKPAPLMFLYFIKEEIINFFKSVGGKIAES